MAPDGFLDTLMVTRVLSTPRPLLNSQIIIHPGLSCKQQKPTSQWLEEKHQGVWHVRYVTYGQGGWGLGELEWGCCGGNAPRLPSAHTVPPTTQMQTLWSHHSPQRLTWDQDKGVGSSFGRQCQEAPVKSRDEAEGVRANDI